MPRTLPRDEDGDFPPRSILRSEYAARQWDAWKQQKYNGSQRAPAALLKYYEEVLGLQEGHPSPLKRRRLSSSQDVS